MAPSILLDDAILLINSNFLGNSWQRQTNQNGVYNGTVTVWKPGSSAAFSVPPELDLNFYGSDINIYGTVSNGVTANYTIDGTTLRPVPFPQGLPNGKTGVNLFSLSNLTENFFQVLNLFPQGGELIIDYITYTPNIDTLLEGLDLVLDDADSPLQYSKGQWNHTTGDFTAGRPYEGTMTGTNSNGATMKLVFEGSDISVYGLLNQVEGRLAASFSVDGQTPTSFNPFNSSQSINASDWKLSQQFFHQDLSPGQHTLLVTLTDVSADQMLWIDSIVYEATSETTIAGASSSPSSSGGTSGLTPIGSSSGSTFPKAAIAGIAAGAFILAMVLFRYARRQWNGVASQSPVGNTPLKPIPLSPLPPPGNSNPWTPWQSHPPPMSPPPPFNDVPHWVPDWQNRPPAPMPVPVPTGHMDGSNPTSAPQTPGFVHSMDGASPDETIAASLPVQVNHAHEDGRD